MKDELLTGAASAAQFTGMSRRQIYRLVEGGHLPCTRKGRRMFFLKSDLRRAFQRERRQPDKGVRRVTIDGVRLRAAVELSDRLASRLAKAERAHRRTATV